MRRKNELRNVLSVTADFDRGLDLGVELRYPGVFLLPGLAAGVRAFGTLDPAEDQPAPKKNQERIEAGLGLGCGNEKNKIMGLGWDAG
jgi:hypothetical protein